MAHRNMVGGTAYDTTGGRALVDGTVYGIQKGKTMVDGTVREIGFGKPITVTITNVNGATSGAFKGVSVVINGVSYTAFGIYTFENIEQITVSSSAAQVKITHNGTGVGKPYTFTPSGSIVNIEIPMTVAYSTIKITTE